MLKKYAQLLVNYCLEIRQGDRLFIQSTTLGEPLVREVYREALRAGASLVETDLAFREKNSIFLKEANTTQIQTVSPFRQLAFQEFEAYLFIRAPFNLREDASTEGGENARLRGLAMKDMMQVYSERTAQRDEKGGMKRNLCQYPTDAAAQEAGMSLEEYTAFVFNACKLDTPDPTAAWQALSREQQRIVDHLNRCQSIRYVAENMDISFRTEGRVWINSDGKTNMPSGEVYTSPVEDSMNGVVQFSFPSIYGGHEVEGATLWVKDGYVEKWEATRGKEFLDKTLAKEGARRFGEAAIGTNYGIQQMTKNILFDEKIGGTIHLALGQSYLQTGGKNQSPVHWDLINDMRSGGEIYANDALIYRNGLFLI